VRMDFNLRSIVRKRWPVMTRGARGAVRLRPKR
jgi:hypothetical protein